MHQSLSGQQKSSEALNESISMHQLQQLLCLMEGFTIASMNAKPTNLKEFADVYFRKVKDRKDILRERGITNLNIGFYLAEDFMGHV